MRSSNLDAIRRRLAAATSTDWQRLDHYGEAHRYRQLCLRVRAGEISDLELQPRYPLVVNGVNVGTYVADFRYVETATGATVTEDFKGFRTPLFKLKAKLVRALYGVEVVEVTG